jgi:hypothetical protein
MNKTMTKEDKDKAISLLKLAIDLAGDGACQAFTDEQEKLMYDLLNEISNPYES